MNSLLLDPVDATRRRLFGAAAAIAAVPLLAARDAGAQSVESQPAQRTSPPPLPAIRQLRAGLLDVGYAECRPADGPPVLLLHGWPYDIHAFADVGPLLAGRAIA